MSRRYALDPLLDAAGMTLSAFRLVQPMSGPTYRIAREQGLSADQADRWANKVGLTPWEIWDDWEDAHARRRRIARESARRRYWEDAEVRERRKAAAKAWREASPRALQFQPSRQPEARRVQSRTYYERNADVLKAKQRERYAARKATA